MSEYESPPSPSVSSSDQGSSSDSSPPSPESSSSPPSPDSSTPSSSPPDSSSSPPSPDSSTPSLSPPDSSSSSPPSPDSSSSSPPSSGNSDSSTSTSPPPPSKSPPPPSPPPPDSSESDSSPDSPPSDGDSPSPPPSPPPPPPSPPPPSPPPSQSDSSPPANSSASDSSSSPSLPPAPPSNSHKDSPSSNSSSPADDSKSPPSKSSHSSPVIPSDSFSSDDKPAQSTPRFSLSPSKGSSDGNGTSTGAVISLALVGIVITLIAVFFVIARRRKKRMDELVEHYRQPSGFSVKSDNFYLRDEIPMRHSSFSDPHYGAPPRLSNASMSMYGSQRGFQGPDTAGGKSCFSYEELMEITNGFSQENLIGEGGFGCVYKGFLHDGRPVAVKQLKTGSGQGEREFRAEVEIISRVHHRHLVSLVGYGISETQRLLVYEFVPNNTLEHHLHGNNLQVLDWSKRLKIAIGSAKGLAYLHEDCHPRIIHRDIKSANILIDNDWEAQVADFGLAKLSNDTHTHVSTRVMGTFGYLAPEYASSGKLTDRSDVFSFGVVLLEVITGRKPVDPRQPLGDESLVEWARPLLVHALETGNFDELVDPRLQNNYDKNEMFRMIEAAAACVRHSAPKRPRMVQVVRALDCEGDMSDLSNGMKFGQSQAYDSGQYSADIQRFRRTALGTEDCSSDYGYTAEYDRRTSVHSGEFRNREFQNHSREYQNRNTSNSWQSGESSSEYSGDAETRAMFRRPSESDDVRRYRYGSRGFP